jgi:hypothetical protein
MPTMSRSRIGWLFSQQTSPSAAHGKRARCAARIFTLLRHTGSQPQNSTGGLHASGATRGTSGIVDIACRAAHENHGCENSSASARAQPTQRGESTGQLNLGMAVILTLPLPLTLTLNLTQVGMVVRSFVQ